MKISMELGITYRFTLVNGDVVDLCVSGSDSKTNKLTIKVNGVEGLYSSIQDALGNPWVKIEKV